MNGKWKDEERVGNGANGKWKDEARVGNGGSARSTPSWQLAPSERQDVGAWEQFGN
jgi:hypothetical protein